MYKPFLYNYPLADIKAKYDRALLKFWSGKGLAYY